MSTIIALDFDDCILPSNSNHFGLTDDALQLLEINLKRLKLIIEAFEIEIFITSSWYSQLTLNEFNEINMVDRSLTVPLDLKPYYKFENMAFALLKNYLDGHVIGLSCGNRTTDIEDLLDKGNKVIILDDWNLQSLDDENENCLFIRMLGFIDGNVGYMIKSFLEDGTKQKRSY